MNQQALDFLKTQRVGVLAVAMPDGSPHGATLHFAHTPDTLEFIFLTERTYRKFEPLRTKKETRASFVVGTSEEDMQTMQMDGILSEIHDMSETQTYRAKFTEKDLSDLDENNDVFLVFKPTW